jgi:hypothetical protein
MGVPRTPDILTASRQGDVRVFFISSLHFARFSLENPLILY